MLYDSENWCTTSAKQSWEINAQRLKPSPANILGSHLKSRSKEKLELRFEAKKPYDRNQNGNTLYKKDQPNTTGKKPRKFKPIKYIWLLGH